MNLFPDQTDLPDIVPMFPLGDVVFFPFTDLKLHIFEPRYREMVKTANEGEGHVAMGMFLPGWEPQYHEAPAIRPMVTVGRLTKVRKEPDGRYHITLTGVTKATVVEEIASPAAFRLIRIAPVVDAPLGAERGEAIRVVDEIRRIVSRVASIPTLGRLRPPTEEEPTDRALIAFSYRMADELKVATSERIAMLESPSCLTRLHLARSILSSVEEIRTAAPKGDRSFHGFSLN